MINRAGMLLAAVILAGIIIRVFSSVPLIITELVYIPPSIETIPKAGNPESTVRRFYMLIDVGRYEEAYDLVLEPDWVKSDRPAPYRDAVSASPSGYYGLISKEEFLDRSRGEMGPRGIFFSLSKIKSSKLKQSGITLPYESIIEYPEYKEALIVKAWGDFLSSCAIYRWEKELPVINTGNGYKIILDGTKMSKENYYLTWLNFSEKKLIKYLKSKDGG
jgi:hypothetical protein